MGQHSIGERFGDYKLVRPLGGGGFASVYLGEEVHNKALAAVKLLKEQKVHDFINEVSRTNRLQHPNIVKILDFGIRTPDDTAFIVMEYAPNGSFREKYPRGSRVPLDVVVPMVKQVASALQYAHDQRVIHRDVKPENLLLNARNMVLLSDFGIATASRTALTAYAGQAGQGDIIGTYAYMAPEQLIGRPVSASDQYSLAIMVYEWLCGRLPFEAREYIQWHYLHEKVPPPSLREHIPSLAPAVEQVILRALAKKPEERFERIETFSLALERAVRGEDVSPVMNMPRPIIHATQFDSAPPGKQANNLARAPSNSIEQLFQEGVRAQANGNLEEAFRIWRQIMATPGIAERYSTTAQNRIRELRTQLMPFRRKQAREANMQGRWRDEIRLILNRDNASARTQLQMLWTDAPFYGDPAGLAKIVGLPTTMSYEKIIAKNNNSLILLLSPIIILAAALILALALLIPPQIVPPESTIGALLGAIFIGLVLMIIGAVGLTQVERIKRKARNIS